MKKEKKIAIFIPTYNASKTLPLVLDRIPADLKKKVKEIFVVDDASQDNTYLIGVGYKKVRKIPNLNVYKHEKNRGYGGNQKFAYRYAINKGFDIVVMLHGDAQYAPEKISYLLEPLEKGKADMVFGSRMQGRPLKGGMPLYKFIGNKVLTAIENRVLGLRLSEYHSGFRLYSCEALKKIPFEICSNDFHFDTDILIQFKVAGLRIAERPIPTYYGDEKSHVNIVKYGLGILYSLSKYVLHKCHIWEVPKFDPKNFKKTKD